MFPGQEAFSFGMSACASSGAQQQQGCGFRTSHLHSPSAIPAHHAVVGQAAGLLGKTPFRAAAFGLRQVYLDAFAN